VLPASITQSGTSVETVVSDNTGLGCLEVLGHDPSVLGSSHIPHTVSDPVCFLLSDVSYRIFRAEMTLEERGSFHPESPAVASLSSFSPSRLLSGVFMKVCVTV